jgi:hypothetical protein
VSTTGRKNSGSGLENRNYRADYTTPLYPKKLELTSPTSGGRSVGIVRSQTKATELLVIIIIIIYEPTFQYKLLTAPSIKQ